MGSALAEVVAMKSFRVRMQHAEVLGEKNKYYCSQVYGYEVTDEDLLWEHFIRTGGAADFAKRFTEAFSPANCWFCSEHFGKHVTDPEILWRYYNWKNGDVLTVCEEMGVLC